MTAREGVFQRLQSEILDRVSEIQRSLPEIGHAPRDAATRLHALKRELRRERARGRCGHWTYNLARHMALLQDVRRAEEALKTARLEAPATPALPETGAWTAARSPNANGPRGRRHAGRLSLSLGVR